MNKRCLSIFMAALLVIGLCACSPNTSSSHNYYTTSAETTENTTAADIKTTTETTLPAESATQQTAAVNQSDDEYDDYISQMSLEEKVGQLFLARCPDTDAVETAQKYHLGGYILFGSDFKGKTKAQVTSTIKSYADSQDIKMLIATDEEGGTVVRVSSNPNLRSKPFLSPTDTYNAGGWQAIEDDASEKADLLLSLGVNVNMAPVCDVTSDPNAFMYYRSFSSNADSQSKYVQKVVSISKSKKLGTVLKHFPGYGNCADTHTGIAYDKRPYSDFENSDFKPFQKGIESGADCILVSHNIVECMDKNMPASLSENVHKIIRDTLNFDGVIMTDDLSMEAITDFTDSEAAAVSAVKCGNDLLCCSDIETQYPSVLSAVKSGEISESSINSSVKRILKWKYNLGIFNF